MRNTGPWRRRRCDGCSSGRRSRMRSDGERIRILHVIDSMGRGGMQNGILNLIHGLDPNRYEHSLCSTRRLDPSQAHAVPDDVRTICIAEGGQARIQAPALARSIRSMRPDVVHSRNWGGVEAVLAGRWARGPALLHSEHGLETDPSAVEPIRRRVMRRAAFELADQVMCVSYQLKEVHARRTGFSESRISVIHNGVDSGR